MNIREMKIEDIPEVIKAGSDESYFITTPDSGGFWTNKQLSNSIKSKSDVLLVAEENDEIIGFTIALLHNPTMKATLENIWVNQKYRRKGIGEQLAKKRLEKLKENGCIYVCALIKEDNTPTINLLEKMGFNKGYKFYWMDKYL